MSVHKVVYKGLSDIREMSKKDLKAAGVDMPGDLLWDTRMRGKRPAVFIENISDRMLEIFKQEGTFTVSEVDPSNLQELEGQEPLVEGREIDDTGTVLRDGTTGQESQKGDPDPNADPVVPSVEGAGPGGSAGGSAVSETNGTVGKGSTGRTGKGRSTSGS